MKRAYESWAPSMQSMSVVVQAETIMEQFRADGYTLTLRQLYYQFVAGDLLPNSQRSYDRLGALVDRARKAGLLDWSMIEDRTRNLAGHSHWTTPADIIRSAMHGYRNDLWKGQPLRIEVWVEKEALAGVVQRAAGEWDLDWFSCRGYVSQSEMWNAARRLGGYIEGGQRVLILHLGDHDPSGLDMTRDIRDRLELFTLGNAGHRLGWGSSFDPALRTNVVQELIETFNNQVDENLIESDNELYDEDRLDPYGELSQLLEVRRIALNMDQIRQYQPPPNPAKLSDSRSTGYVEEFGSSSWELDALSPQVLAGLIESEVVEEINTGLYETARRKQERGRELLTTVSDRWTEVVEWIDQ